TPTRRMPWMAASRGSRWKLWEAMPTLSPSHGSECEPPGGWARLRGLDHAKGASAVPATATPTNLLREIEGAESMTGSFRGERSSWVDASLVQGVFERYGRA